jgi:uncharacterized repeat protein (TIGR03803 family)
VLDSSGNLYGATVAGGDPTCLCGAVFKVDSSGKETILYRFHGKADGQNVYGGLFRDRPGNLYGTTNAGGQFLPQCAGNPLREGCGTVFKIAP